MSAGEDARVARDRRRAALFIDFDNIVIGLGGNTSDAAQTFGTRPASWLRWLERTLCAGAGDGALACRFLVRRCYLNPETFRSYRPYFIRLHPRGVRGGRLSTAHLDRENQRRYEHGLRHRRYAASRTGSA